MTARSAYLRVTLAPGESRMHAPCHLDCLLGAARPVRHLDGRGPLDAALGGAGRFQARSVFHARRSLGRAGQQAAGFSDDEEQLGLSRTYLVEMGDPDGVARAIDRLRGLDVVESAGAELLARSYRAPAATRPDPPTRREAEVPFAMVGAAAAHRIEPGSDRIRVGVVDTGVALDHPELAGRIVAGYDFVDLGLGRLADGPELLGRRVRPRRRARGRGGPRHARRRRDRGGGHQGARGARR